jgi:hypothetical protein
VTNIGRNIAEIGPEPKTMNSYLRAWAWLSFGVVVGVLIVLALPSEGETSIINLRDPSA